MAKKENEKIRKAYTKYEQQKAEEAYHANKSLRGPRKLSKKKKAKTGSSREDW